MIFKIKKFLVWWMVWSIIILPFDFTPLARVNYWKSVALSTDMNLGLNWNAGDLATTDTCIFCDTSVVNATATAAFTAKCLKIRSTYTGAWSTGNYNFMTSGNDSFQGPGAGGSLTLGTSTLIDSGGNFILANIGGTVSAASAIIDMRGTGTLSIAKGGCYVCTLKTAQTSGLTTTLAGFGSAGWNSQLIFGPGTTTNNTNVTFYSNSTGTTNPFLNSASGTINGTGTYTLGPYNATGTQTIKIPAITFVGSLTLDMYNNGAGKDSFDLTGNVSSPTIELFTNASNGKVTLTTNNNTLTAATVLYVGGAGGSDFNMNFGSSTVSVGRMRAYNTVSTQNFNMGSSSWTDGGHWDFGTNWTVTPGTSNVTLNGTAAATITSKGKSFHKITINKTAVVAVAQGDSLVCDTLITQGSCNYSTAGFKLRADCVNFDNTGTLNLATSNITANVAGFHLGSAVAGAVTLTNDTITSLGKFDITKTGLTFPRVILNGTTTIAGTFTATRMILMPNITYTWTAANTVTLSTYTATDWDGTSGNRIVFVSSMPGTRWNLVAPASMTVNWVNVRDCNNSGTKIKAKSSVNSGNNIGWDFGAGFLDNSF